MKIKNLIAGAVVAVAGAFSLLVAQPAMAVTCPSGSINSSADTLAGCNVKPDEGKGLMDTVLVIINVILAVLGIVTVLMIILGGVNYTTSQGDPTKAAKAKNTILYGVIGLVIALLAFAVVNFVLTEVFGSAGGGGGNSTTTTTTTTTTDPAASGSGTTPTTTPSTTTE